MLPDFIGPFQFRDEDRVPFIVTLGVRQIGARADHVPEELLALCVVVHDSNQFTFRIVRRDVGDFRYLASAVKNDAPAGPGLGSGDLVKTPPDPVAGFCVKKGRGSRRSFADLRG